MGKTVKTIVGAALLVASFFVPGSSSLYFAIGGLNVAASTAFVLQTLGALSLTLGLSPRIPGLDVQDQLAENLHIFSSPLATRAIPFGRVPVAGQILYRSNIEGSGDTPDEVLLILGLAGYPGDALEKFWLNGELVFDGDSTTGPGAITSGTFADDLWVWFRTGHETSQAFPDIATLDSVWDEKSRILRGIPAIGLRVKVTEDLEGRLEPLAQFRGGRWYDPRLDSTVPGGSGTHRIDDQDTWEFSVNPKIAELAYLIGGEVNGKRIFGMGKSAAAIDLENFASEANICEEQIDVVGGGTIDRYTCNGLLVPEPDHRTNLNKLLSASAGTMDASGGIYRTFAGAWRSPSMTLTESDIDGAPTNIELQKDPSEETNIVRGSFSDPNDEGQVKEYPELRDSTSITQIGENPMTLDLPFTNDHRMAQRIAKITLRRENAARKFAGNYWLRTLSLQPGDIVTQTYGRYTIDSETFRVDVWGAEAGEDRDGAQRLMVPMQLVEEQQSWFDWDETTEEQSLTGVTSLLPNMDRRPKLITLDGVPVFEGASPPANPKTGWLWRDTDVNVMFRWNGSAWVDYSTLTRLSGGSLDNAGIEKGNLDGWTPGLGTWTAVTTEPRFGTYHLRGEPATGVARIYNNSRLQVEEGDRVMAMGFVQRNGSGSADVRVWLRFLDSSDTLVHSVFGNTVTGTDYAPSRAIGTAQANVVTAEFAFELVNSDGPAAFCDGAWMGVILPGSVDTDQIGDAAVTENVLTENTTDTELATAFGGAYGTVGGANFTVPSGQTWRLSIEYTVWADVGASAGNPAGNFRALVNGTPIQEIRGFNSDMASQQHQFSWTHVDDFSAGNQSFTLEGRATSGACTKRYAIVKITVLKR